VGRGENKNSAFPGSKWTHLGAFCGTSNVFVKGFGLSSGWEGKRTSSLVGWMGRGRRDAGNEGPSAEGDSFGDVDAYQGDEVPIQFRIPRRASMTEGGQR
jgi:hypothetical protein